MSASPVTPSNVDNIGPPAAKRPKPQTTPPSSMGRSPGQGGSPGVKTSNSAAVVQGGPTGSLGGMMAGGPPPNAAAQFRLQPQQQSPNFLCNPSTSLNDLPETSTGMFFFYYLVIELLSLGKGMPRKL